MHEQIRSLRVKAGLTQTQLADALGYSSSSTVAMWESGQRRPPSSKLPAIAKVLLCDISELFSVKEINTDMQ